MREGLKVGVPASAVSADLVETGQMVAGPFRCVSCGYGVTVYRALPICPMCGGTAWQPAGWRPSGRRSERPYL